MYFVTTATSISYVVIQKLKSSSTSLIGIVICNDAKLKNLGHKKYKANQKKYKANLFVCQFILFYYFMKTFTKLS